MAVSIKQEIFISWIPRGQIEIAPKIYASIIIAPHVEEIVADTSRKISNVEIISADTKREIIFSQQAQADTCRAVQKSEILSADTLRKTYVEDIANADTFRQVQSTEIIFADTRRKISNLETVSVDTCRSVIDSTLPSEIIADTLLRNAYRENISADTSRQVVSSESIIADTSRKTVFTEIISADTLLQNACRESISADTKLVVNQGEIILADTLRKVTLTENISADTLLQLREIIKADTFRQVVKFEEITADTKIRIPHILKYTINSPLVNTFKDYGLTSLSITLQEKTLSDTFQLETVRPMEINDEVKGALLDYPISFLVEETNQRDLVQSVKGMYDQDKLLYTRIQLAVETIILKTNGHISIVDAAVDYPAQSYLETIAHYLGLTTDIKFEPYVTYNITVDQNTTYANLLSALFGWTSRVPQRQINVFIRGDTLHCIQRGYEESVFDISDLPHSRPTISKKLLRTMWNRGTFEEDDDKKDKDTGEYSEIDISEPFSGTVEYWAYYGATMITHKLIYKAGYLVTEYTRSESSEYTSQSQTIYTYETMDSKYSKSTIDYKTYFASAGVYYLAEKSSYNLRMQYGDITGEWGRLNDKVEGHGKSSGSSGTSQNTKYSYRKTDSGDVYLYLELEKSTSASGTSDSKTSTRETYHSPLGNGWYAQNVYVDGEPQGSNISQGAPGNAVTPYTVNEVQKTFTDAKITPEKKDDEDDVEEAYKKLRKSISPIADVSFPVRDITLLFELTKALEWLDRKTQEEITVDITDKVIAGVPEHLHIIDFTERILLDGAEYFLVSNNIQFTPKKLIQKLRLIRWY